MKWRYIAERISTGEILDYNVPLSDVEIVDRISGAPSLRGNIGPVQKRLIAADGRPLFDEWSTAIYAVSDEKIMGGGILTGSTFTGPNWALDCTGFTGYAYETPYTGAWFGVEVDPADVFREIWRHVQSFPNGNIGLEIDTLLTGLSIGVELQQIEFDTQSGPVSFEAGPVKLAWYLDQDCGDEIDNLCETTPMDWHEELSWADPSMTSVRKFCRLGFPQIGSRRNDLSFVFGENVSKAPGVSRPGEDYANEVLILGNGEGSDMLRGSASVPSDRLRRAKVVTDKALISVPTINTRARREVRNRRGVGAITEVTIDPASSHAPLGSWAVGDEILVRAKQDWNDTLQWSRILSSTIKPNDSDYINLGLQRVETNE